MHNIENIKQIIKVLQDANISQINEYDNPVEWLPYGVIGNAQSKRQALTVINKLKDLKLGQKPWVDSTSEVWIVIEYSFCMIHIFAEEARSYYKLDEIWQKNRRINEL